MEALGRQAKRRSDDSLAQSASEQVRAIVEAAEASANEIERSAEQEAQQIRSDAARDAERTRADAVERAQGHVGNVSGATGEMLDRVEAMQRELGTLLETLRTGANRVHADLSLLETNMAELYTAAGAGDRRPEDDMPRTPEVEAFDNRAHAAEPAAEPEDIGAPEVAFERELEPEPLAAAPAPPAAAEPADGDAEGARLIALNMALNGQPREETDRYLADNFDLADRAQLLEEVYSSIETG
jgi:hypothetical protein